MAEYCFECYKKYLDPDASEVELIISGKKDLELCEGCGQYKRTVIARRFFYFPGYIKKLLRFK